MKSIDVGEKRCVTALSSKGCGASLWLDSNSPEILLVKDLPLSAFGPVQDLTPCMPYDPGTSEVLLSAFPDTRERRTVPYKLRNIVEKGKKKVKAINTLDKTHL